MFTFSETSQCRDCVKKRITSQCEAFIQYFFNVNTCCYYMFLYESEIIGDISFKQLTKET